MIGSVSKVTWNVSDTPYGLSLTSTGNVLVVIGANKNIISEYTPDGSLVRQVTYSGHSWHVAEVNNDRRAISSTGSVTGISMLATNGTVIRSFGSAIGSSLTQMNDVRCFAIDSNGYILAADRGNNRILVIDPTMTTARQLTLLVNPALQAPIAVDLDESRGRLYIGEDVGGQSRVLVFDGLC